MTYLEEKVDVWIENSIKETRMAAKCQNKGENDGRINAKITRTRNWVTRMGRRLGEKKSSKKSQQGAIIKGLSISV